MKLSEIKNALDKGESIETLNIKVKKFLPIASKMMMVLGYKEGEEEQSGIVDECIEMDKNGIVYVNHFKKNIAVIISIITHYTDIEIDEVNIENTLYDFYMEYGIWNYVKNSIDIEEYNNIIELIDKSIEELIRRHNSIESLVSSALIKIIDKLPDHKQINKIIKSGIKDLNKLDWDKVPMLKQMLEIAQNKNNK